MSPQTKKCSKCGEEKELAEFSKNKNTKDGYSYHCKACLTTRATQWKQDNKGRVKEYNQSYRKENKERLKEYDQSYRKENKERIREIKRQWRAENPEKVRDQKRREYLKNKQDYLDRAAKWRAENPEKKRLNDQKRRARKLENGCENFTKEQLKEHWVQEGIDPKRCYYCEEAPFEHIDHYVPLAKGGPHFMSNLRPSCASCNTSKSDRDPKEWMKERSIRMEE